MHSFLLPMNRVGEGRVIISYNILGNLNNLKSVMAAAISSVETIYPPTLVELQDF